MSLRGSLHSQSHPPERVGGDVKKTNILIAAYPDAVILRLRIDATPLPPFESGNVLVVHVPSQAMNKSMPAVALVQSHQVSTSVHLRLSALCQNLLRRKFELFFDELNVCWVLYRSSLAETLL